MNAFFLSFCCAVDFIIYYCPISWHVKIAYFGSSSRRSCQDRGRESWPVRVADAFGITVSYLLLLFVPVIDVSSFLRSTAAAIGAERRHMLFSMAFSVLHFVVLSICGSLFYSSFDKLFGGKKSHEEKAAAAAGAHAQQHAHTTAAALAAAAAAQDSAVTGMLLRPIECPLISMA
jgi:hypothetical protein